MAKESFNVLTFLIRKVPMNTCSTLHRWKRSTNMICSIDRLNNIKSHRMNKVNSSKEGLD